MKTYSPIRHLLVDLNTRTATVEWADRPDAEDAAELLGGEIWVTVTDSGDSEEVQVTLTPDALADLREIAGLEDDESDLETMWKVVVIEVLENPVRTFRWGTPPAGARLIYTTDRNATAGIEPHTPSEAKYAEFWGYRNPADRQQVRVVIPQTWATDSHVEVIEWTGTSG